MNSQDWISLATLVVNMTLIVWHNRKNRAAIKTSVTSALTSNRTLLSRTLAAIAEDLSKEFGNKAVAQEVETVAVDTVETVAHLQGGAHV
jgi:hypothetical protein